MLRRVRQLFTQMLAPSSERLSTKPRLRRGPTFHPHLEPLELRAVPALVVRTGAANTSFDNTANWIGGVCPQAGDDVIFRPPVVATTEEGPVYGTPVNCTGMHAATGAYNSVTLEAGYTATVTLVGGFSTKALVLAGGTLNQPTATSPYSATNISVIGGATGGFPSGLIWTGSTLNDTNHLADLTITGSGTTALFAPAGGGTIYCGSNINLEDGAAATMREGALNTTNEDQEFNINEDCGLNVDPGEGKTAAILTQNVDVGPKMVILADAWVVVLTGTFDVGAEAQVRNFGGALVLLPDAEAYFRGVDGGFGYDQQQANPVTVLWPGSKLRSDHTIRIQSGKLVTIGDSSAASTVTIDCPKLTVTGGEVLLGRSPSDFSTHYSPYYFSVLTTTGTVDWEGGTYRPYMQTEDETGALADLWWATAEFKVGTATASPTLAPVPINYENSVVTPPSGYTGMVLKSSNFITQANNNAPAYDTDVWVLDPRNIPVDQLWMRAK